MQYRNALAAIAVGGWAIGALAQPALRTQAVQPDERLRAVVTAPDARVLAAEDLDAKGREPRRARIVVASAARGTAAEAIVEVDTGRVMTSRSLTNTELPFTTEQLQQATAIAVRDPAVRRLLGPDAGQYRANVPGQRAPGRFLTEGFAAASADPADPCARTRCVDLLFIRDGRYVAGTQVTVELAGRRVTLRADRGHEGGHR